MKKHLTVKLVAAFLVLAFGLWYGTGLFGSAGTGVSLTDLSGERSAMVDATVQGALTDGSFAQEFAISASSVTNRFDPLETEWQPNYRDVTPVFYPDGQVTELETQSYGSCDTVTGVCDTLRVYLVCSNNDGECVIPTGLTKTARPGATFRFYDLYDAANAEPFAEWNFTGEYLRGSYDEPLADGITNDQIYGNTYTYTCNSLGDADGNWYVFISPPEGWDAKVTEIYQITAVQRLQEWFRATQPDTELDAQRTVRSLKQPRGSWELVAAPQVVNGTVLGVHQTDEGLVALTQTGGTVQAWCAVNGKITDSATLLQLETGRYTGWQADTCPQQFATDACFAVRYQLDSDNADPRAMSFATAMRVQNGRFESCQTAVSKIEGPELKTEQGDGNFITEARPGYAFLQVQLNGAGDLVTVEQLCTGDYRQTLDPDFAARQDPIHSYSTYDYATYGGATTLSVHRAGELTYRGEIASTRADDAKKFGGYWWGSQEDEIRELVFTDKVYRDLNFAPTHNYLYLNLPQSAELESVQKGVAA